MIKKELRKEINVLKSKKEDEIDLLEWRFWLEKIFLKNNDNDKDDYFHGRKLDKIKEKSKQEVDKINELIREKEVNIIDNDAILKLKDYKRDVQEE